MAHLYVASSGADAGVYYPDASETGKVADEVTGLGDTVGNADIPTDGSVHVILYKVLILAASGVFRIRNTTDGSVICNIAATGNSPQVLDFGPRGLRIPGGFDVTVPAAATMTIIYDQVSS